MTKVHVEARKFAEQGYTIVLIGHQGHEEVEGTTGEAPENIVLVETVADVDALELPDPDHVAFITQTTLSVDETSEIIARLRERFPKITAPKSDDICYATTNRQIAVKQLARGVRAGAGDRLDQLVELQPAGRGRPRARRRLAPDRQRLAGRRGLARGVETVGITSGASAPEGLVTELVEFFRARGADDVSELRAIDEDVRFMLPKKIRTELAARALSPSRSSERGFHRGAGLGSEGLRAVHPAWRSWRSRARRSTPRWPSCI